MSDEQREQGRDTGSASRPHQHPGSSYAPGPATATYPESPVPRQQGLGSTASGGYGAYGTGAYGAYSSAGSQNTGGYGAGGYGSAYGAPGGFSPPQDPAYGGAMVPMGGGQRGPIGKIRNPVMTVVISCICFVYAIIQVWQMINELKAFRGKDDLNPIFFFIPILNYIELWKLNEKVLDAKRMAGVPNPTVPQPILYLLLWIYFLPADLNEVWKAAGGGGPR